MKDLSVLVLFFEKKKLAQTLQSKMPRVKNIVIPEKSRFAYV